MRKSILATLFVTLGIAVGCGGDEGGDVAATLSDIQAQIFTPSCAFGGCHDGSAGPTQANLILTSGQSFAQLVNMPSEKSPMLRVVPGDAANSFLVKKLKDPAGTEGLRMPSGSPALSAAKIAAIEKWITDGAANN